MADLRPSTKLQAGLNIIRTIFVCAILSVASLMFSKDANTLVIEPIERMTAKIKRISQNPLEAAIEDEVNTVAMEKMHNQSAKKDKNKGEMETEVLENVIMKIGALLALGFGEAGTEIITANIKRGSGDIDPMVPGKKTFCIFGFCDIRGFAEVTEVLQEGVMLFVNEIAEIVHNTVFRFAGSANKNIGDAFLLVWKLPKSLDHHFKAANLQPIPHILHQYADMALVGFLKVLAAVNSDSRVLKYRLSPELAQKLPGFAVKMGFGLHVGWAIEGAIGSEFKVDASYLSPNVNMASRLEAATRQFGVPLLISGELHDLLSVQIQLIMREVDCVMVKGSKVPTRLFTCDVSINSIPPLSAEESLAGLSASEAKVELRRQRDYLLKAAVSKQREVWRLFDTDPQLVAMRSSVSLRFVDLHRQAYGAYTKGDWTQAKQLMQDAMDVKWELDGPSRALMGFMEEHGFRAPADWAGFRALTEK